MIFCNIISNLDFAKRLPGHSLSVHQKGSLRAKSCTNMGREAATYLCHSSNFLLMHCSSKFSFWWGLCTCPYACLLQESDKSQIFYWSSQTCSRIRQLIGWLVDGLLTMLKNLKTALFQTFSTWHRILSAFTALYWPSTAFYWPNTTKYQTVPPYTDQVPSCINQHCPMPTKQILLQILSEDQNIDKIFALFTWSSLTTNSF